MSQSTQSLRSLVPLAIFNCCQIHTPLGLFCHKKCTNIVLNSSFLFFIVLIIRWTSVRATSALWTLDSKWLPCVCVSCKSANSCHKQFSLFQYVETLFHFGKWQCWKKYIIFLGILQVWPLIALHFSLDRAGPFLHHQFVEFASILLGLT